MSKSRSTDKRLLDALEYVDEKYLAEITDSYEVIDLPGEYRPDRRGLRRAYLRAAVSIICILVAAALLSSVPALLGRLGIIPAGTLPPDTEPPAEDPERYIFTEADLEKLNKIWLSTYNEKFAETVDEAVADWRFRGKYGDSIIIRYNSALQSMYTTIIGEYKIVSAVKGFTVYHNYDGYNLLHAYEFGLLTDADLDKFYEYHSGGKYETSVTPYPEEQYICQTSVPVALTPEELSDIVHAYFKWCSVRPGGKKMNGIYHVRCFGKADGVYAVMVDDLENLSGSGGSYTESVGGAEFISPYGQRLWIYKDGEIEFGPTEAYEKGMVTSSQLQALAKSFNETIALYPRKQFFDFSSRDPYEPNKAVVTLMPYADPLKYTAEDFADIGCIAAEPYEDGQTEQKLVLTFMGKTKDDMEKALDILRRRSDILYQEPLYINVLEEEAFLAEYVGDGIEYYGRYGNCHVTYTDYGDLIAFEEKVGKYTFKYPNGNGVRAFYIDEYITLKEAYDRGLLTDEDIDDIYELYTD